MGGRGYAIMRELARMGLGCVIITSDSNSLAKVPQLKSVYELQEVDGLKICWVRTWRYTVAKSVKRILSWLHFEWRLFWMPLGDLPKPNVIVVSSLSLLTILNGFLWRRRYRCRLIFEVRDIWPLTIIEEGGYSKINPFVITLGWVERLGYRYADGIVGTMPNLREHVMAVLGYEREVACVPMGVDAESLNNLQPIPVNYERSFIPSGKFIVAHVGTVGITNALATLLECAVLLHSRADIHFLIVGDGDLKAGYQKQYGFLNNLTFAPRVPKAMVQSILARCDVLYFSTHRSSVWRYGQSLNKVIDYMISGRPIIGSYSGFPSMINEAECGRFVTSGDVQALKDQIVYFASLTPDFRLHIGARGRDWILEHRLYRVLAKNYLTVLFPTEGKSQVKLDPS